ncbi:MAG: cytosolic protein [Candidatus Parabeggiatoa sp. nov. 2]|nr:MAG: cytosolic protein [Beggiatoa sp. 4572_84]RKZ56794.1 MAG: cytosolic protein [Gammaproteobacteria bacterium]
MGKITQSEIVEYVEKNIVKFHKKRLEKLEQLKLNNVLKKKNPYLFKAKNINTAQDYVKNILDAFLSSQEEGIFGLFLEELAIFICSKVYKGVRSSYEGMDLEFDKDKVKYIVSIKSGPNWGNSDQIKRMRHNFKKITETFAIHNPSLTVVAVNGCCYGQDNVPDKGDYLKLCGQRFWSFISGNEQLYTEIIEPLGHQAKQRNQEFMDEYANVINRFTFEFLKKFCHSDGQILWEEIVKFNSSMNQ